MEELFRKIHIFAGINDAGIQWLVKAAATEVMPPAEVIVRESEPGNRFYLVEKGTVRVIKHFGTPDEVLLATLNPNDFFGEMCILEAQPRSATVAAITETTLHSLSGTDFYHFYQQMPDQYGVLVLNIARDLSRRLRYLDEIFAARH